MPAAAVIPAPIAYIKVAAVKKLVVGFVGWPSGGGPSMVPFVLVFGLPFLGSSVLAGIRLSAASRPSFTVKKLECSKQA